MNASPPHLGIEPLEARIAPATFLVTNTLDSGAGSLRQAILDANAFSGADTITFSISVSSVIELKTHLPAITETVHIVSSTTGGSRIAINGSTAVGAGGANTGSGLMLLGSASSNSTIKGLAIYGFDQAGIEIVGSSSNQISGNYLGLNAFGNLTNTRMAEGILINGGTGNKIGLTQAGNLIGGNDIGVRITGGASSTAIDYNWIGVTSANSYSSLRSNDVGILVEAASGTQIGNGGSNTIAGNQSFGIKLASTANNTTIFRNRIGSPTLNPPSWTGTQEWGIFVDGANATTIGSGTYQPRLNQGNEISGNSAGGIWIRTGSGPGTTQIAGNIIGASSLEGAIMRSGNGGPGILVTTRLIGENTTTQSLLISSNLISANVGAGIELRCFGQKQPTTITGNMIGTDLGGTKPLGNGTGIIVDGADMVTIGGKGANTIAGSVQDGILIKDSTNVTVLGNNIGFSAILPHSSSLANGGDGIRLLGVGVVNIGNPSAQSSANKIFYNGGDGIFLDGNTPSSRALKPIVSISGNWIGMTPDASLSNLGAGIRISDVTTDSEDPKLGYNSIANNLVYSAFTDGIVVERSFGIQIKNNDATAVDAALRLNNAMKTIAIGNTFRSTNRDAVVIDRGTSGTVFGTLEIGNSLEGDNIGLVIEEATNNTIIGNLIRGTTTGITVHSGEDNLISQNQFTVTDQGLFIDLGGDGITPNDPLDADAGPNNLQNSPLLVSAALSGGQTLLRGEYRGAALSDVRIEWYVNGEFLAEMDVRTDENGLARLMLDLDHALEAGAKVNASATSGSNTSEFSAGVAAEAPPEVIAKGAAAGQKPRVQLRDAATGEVVLDRLAFGKGFRGGVRVAAADVDGDGFTDLIATPHTGSGVVKVFSGLDGHLISRFEMGPGNDPSIRSIAAGDLDGDGSIEVVIGRNNAMGGRVLIHDALTGAFESRHTPFGFDTPDRLSVGLKDTDGDHLPEIVIKAEIFGDQKRVVLDPISGQIERIARLARA